MLLYIDIKDKLFKQMALTHIIIKKLSRNPNPIKGTAL